MTIGRPRNQSRESAMRRGALYFQGRPCKLGHTLRYVVGYHCVHCVKLREVTYKARDNKEDTEHAARMQVAR